MKKGIIICAFSVLIIVTTIAFIWLAVDSYNYDMDPNNGVDLFEGVAAFLIMLIGGLVVLYEVDSFYVVYYFFVKQKTKTKSILNILSNLSLACMLLYGYLYVFDCLPCALMGMNVFEITSMVLFLLYVILRITYIIVATSSFEKER